MKSEVVDYEPIGPRSSKNINIMIAITLSVVIGIGIGIAIDRAINVTFGVVANYPSDFGGCSLPINGPKKPKNLIFLIGDGFGPAALTFARTIAGRKLSFDNFLVGKSITRSSDSYITDSAAGATALTCGLKTNNDAVAVDKNYTARATIMEAAVAAGMPCGIVVTSEIHHATPASFNSHAADRSMTNFIAKQQIASGVQLMFGGGGDEFSKPEILQVAKEKGYDIIHSHNDLNQTQLPSLGVFSTYGLPFEIDRYALDPNAPSLLEMSTRALDLFKKKDNGFFLFIEGSQIDWAEHNNDPVALYHEIMQFEQVFELVVNFAKERNDTLIIATADHETGGISLGRQTYGEPKSEAFRWYPDVIKNSTRSSKTLGDILNNLNGTDLYSTFTKYTQIILNFADIDFLNRAKNKEFDMQYAVSSIVSSHARIGWTTLQHTGVDVNVYGYGPGINFFCGLQDNTEIGNKLANIFGWNLDELSAKMKDFNTTG